MKTNKFVTALALMLTFAMSSCVYGGYDHYGRGSYYNARRPLVRIVPPPVYLRPRVYVQPPRAYSRHDYRHDSRNNNNNNNNRSRNRRRW
jgi:hypothetical protein